MRTLTHRPAEVALVPSIIQIPGEGWAIKFTSPELSKKQAYEGINYAFRATSGRFNLSLFVEPPQGKKMTHLDCCRYYWPQASRNPMISEKSVVLIQSETHCRIQYDIIMDVDAETLAVFDKSLTYGKTL